MRFCSSCASSTASAAFSVADRAASASSSQRGGVGGQFLFFPLASRLRHLQQSGQGISPQTAVLGSGALILKVSGSNFALGATVNWNGAPLPTTFSNSTQLSATIAASLITSIGSAQI